ncbi:hypothetical protein N5P37_011117 [Trichoderma harzianum]|uniref:Zn(2)-C6 fungal-type domain-containing protein n=1 Tax=Trichoderma harzianum CBS 226.95 TaxID=983964 RepID=A0A2T3ZW64_TRIHA|nr:hypothetical protein M431DRAFT_98492 [Trichoderma harzianum CBS 226.95]KAK0756202.1 hypothetical protein N5P37_011117 [Trichoderma harzianum]PKK46249.1 hypothetical protein CI102_9455 [Trichoderma harzianum]PTB49055.1 hypothetical protein M431DRAFT_98492 [Trichoderma harzianum CBS 226.95]
MASSSNTKDGVLQQRNKPVGKPRGMRRDRDCRSCKLRDVKCDLNRPSCGECIAAGVPCGGYPQRVIWVGASSSAKDASLSSTSTSPSIITRPRQARSQSTLSRSSDSGLTPDRPADSSLSPPDRPVSSPGDEPINWSEADQNSFIRPLVSLCQQIISLDGDALRSNHYLSVEALRLISRLRDFVQARIDGHPARASTGRGDLWESEAMARYRLDALMSLKDTLKATNPFAFIGIAAFAFFEVCDSGFGDWQRHLYGAKSLLDYHCKSRAELDTLSRSVTGLGEMVIRLVWFDTTGSIIRGTTDLIFESWHRDLLTDSFFRTVGCPADTFQLFTRVASGEVASNPSNSAILAMEQLLKLNQGTTDWDRSANAYRCAGVIAVLTRVSEEPAAISKAATITLAVDRACQIIAATPSSSQFYIHMAVPAYLAGINASTVKQCDVIRAYWHNCNHAGVRRYPDGLARCEERWKMKGLA